MEKANRASLVVAIVATVLALIGALFQGTGTLLFRRDVRAEVAPAATSGVSSVVAPRGLAASAAPPDGASARVRAPSQMPAAPDSTASGAVPRKQSRRSRSQAEVTIVEGRPVTPKGFPVTLSINFTSVHDMDVATLVVAPFGEPASPHAVLAAGADVPFSSSGERFDAQVLTLDFVARSIVLRVDRLPNP